MKYSGIGGQAVMEGVMMKNGERYAIAVRKPDQDIAVEVKDYTGLIKNEKVRHIPILRGVLNFIDSLALGISTLTYSASFFEEEEQGGEKPLDKAAKKKKESRDGIYGGIVFCSCDRDLYAASVLSVPDFS